MEAKNCGREAAHLRLERSDDLAQRVSYGYACALLVVLALFLPYGGYERMMEGKYHCYLALTLGYLAALCAVVPVRRPRLTAMQACAVAYLAWAALSAACSPYGAAALLGGTRRDGLLTLALYVATFLTLSRYLRPDTRLLALTALSVTLCDALTLAQIAGFDPLRLYPEGLGYWDGDLAYAGFYAGTAGNIDFTAFLLALALCVLAAAIVRLKMWALAPTVALTLWTLARLGVATAWVGVACAAVWGLALLCPKRRGLMLAVSAGICVLGVVFVACYTGGNQTLREASLLLHGEARSDFGSARWGVWLNCLVLARERPLLGGGPGTLWLRNLPPFLWTVEGETVESTVTAAHNEYLHTLVELGAPALAAYLALLIAAIVRCYRRAADTRWAVCGVGLVCYAAMACFSIATCITAPYVWLLLSLCVGAENDWQSLTKAP